VLGIPDRNAMPTAHPLIRGAGHRVANSSTESSTVAIRGQGVASIEAGLAAFLPYVQFT
jgi:hypothetical protein